MIQQNFIIKNFWKWNFILNTNSMNRQMYVQMLQEHGASISIG